MLGTGHPEFARIQQDGYCITWYDAERQKAEVDATEPNYELIDRIRRDTPKYSQEWNNKDWGEYDLVLDPELLHMFPDAVYRPHPRKPDATSWKRKDTTSNPIHLIKNARSVHSNDSSLLIDAMLWGIPAYAYNPNSMFHGMSQPDKWLTWFFTQICKEVTHGK